MFAEGNGRQAKEADFHNRNGGELTGMPGNGGVAAT
jgi:hypothetical protein